jgi:hypothetical protein
MRKPNATYPDTLILWDVTWTKQGEVWVGPAITTLWPQGLEIVTTGKAKKDDNAYQR